MELTLPMVPDIEIAAARAGVDASNAIAESDENAFPQGILLRRARRHVETFLFRNPDKLFVKWRNLTRRYRMNACTPHDVHPEVVP